MKNYLNSFAKSGLGVILSALFGLLLLRFISRDLGVAGIAKFGIYRQFIQLCTVFLSWGNGFSIIESYSKAIDKDHFTTNSFKYFQITAFVLSLVIVIFSKPISYALFNDTESSQLILFSPLVFLGLTNYSFFRFVLSAKKYLLSSGLLQALPFVVMIAVFSFSKSLNIIFMFAYLVSAFIAFIVWRSFSIEKIILFSNIQRLYEFEKTSFATIITGAVGFFCPLIVKSMSMHFLGLENTGVLEAEFSLVSYFTLAIISGLGTFYLGVVSEKPKDLLFREKIFGMLVPTTALGLSVVIYFQEIFLSVLFGKEILRLTPDLAIFGLAEMLRCINWFFIFSMIGLSFRKSYIILDTISNLSYILFSLIFVFYFPNKTSIECGYLTFQAIYLILNLIFCFKLKVIHSKLSVGLTLFSISLILATIYVRNLFHG